MSRYRIKECSSLTLNADHPEAEFGRAHRRERWHIIETIAHPPVPIPKQFGSFGAAQKYAKKHRLDVAEIA